MANKITLLDVVSEVLDSLDSDPVNSVIDTVESEQVVSVARAVYRNMTSNRDWAFFRRPVQLTPSGDTALPTHMRIEESIKELVFVNYNTVKLDEKRKKYKRMIWLEPDDFLRKANQLDNTSDDVDIIIDPTGIEIALKNDTAPHYYTSFDDDTLVFDSYDKEVDSTLQNSKTQAVAYIMPVFTANDNWVIDLPQEALAAYIAEVKSVAFVELKQQENAKAEQESRRQQSWLSRKGWRVNGGVKYQNYGRSGRKGYNRYGNPFDKSSYIKKV